MRINKWITFSLGVILALGVCGLLLYGLYDIDALRVSEGDDAGRESDFQFLDLSENITLSEIGHSLGHFLWNTKAADVLILGVTLFVAAEAAATAVKGLQEQYIEFRDLCDTNKFMLLEEQEEEQEQEEN
jgi:hypothetical protein